MIFETRIPTYGEIRYRHKFCLFPYTWECRSVRRTYWLMWVTIKEEWVKGRGEDFWARRDVAQGKLGLTYHTW